MKERPKLNFHNIYFFIFKTNVISTLPEFGQLNVLTSFTADNLGLVALPSRDIYFGHPGGGGG